MINTNIKSNNKVVVVLGPTSSGKSDAAISLAKKFDGEVISADSRQVFRDMNLGTGKVEGEWVDYNSPQPPLKLKGGAKNIPSLEKGGSKRICKKVFISEEIPHHLLDFRSPRGTYNVSQFQKDCNQLIQEIAERGKLPIICGGTGFWISAVVDGMILPNVAPDKKLRKKLGKKTTKQLFCQLKRLDPTRAKTIDQNNKFRLIRAIEICKAIGKVPKIEVLNNPPRSPLGFFVSPSSSVFLQIGIDWPQEKLDQKIKKRLEGRWTDGMIKEVKELKEKYDLSWKKIQSFGLAYFWIPLYLQKKLSLEELKEKVFVAERRYAKRQRTWFKRDRRILWSNNYREIGKMVRSFIGE